MPGDGITDWRQWTDQQEAATNTPFPGQGPINDFEIIGNTSAVVTTLTNGPTLGIPTWTYVPTAVNAVDPFGGWTAQKETDYNTPIVRPPGT